ncbi:hypothetical protein K492DRAFT_190785 [Lichtheimia hyalospora FSU 10163]|nr:hypothetical protein K492DRAFT_190785 [Lichtheimia hyalospora FSU 10163]
MAPASSSITTTPSNDNPIVTQSPPLPLAQSTVYNQYFPIVIVCLVSLYTVAYVARWIRWHYRRRRKRAMWLERGRLRMYWHQALERKEKNHHCQAIAMNGDPLPQLPEAALTIPRPATFPTTSTSTTSTTLTSNDSLFSRPRSITFFNSPSSSTAASSYTTSTFHHSSSSPVPVIPPPIKQSWIYNNKRKRRRLMWQWSVAMGYCRYSHAARMENVIASIQQETNEKIEEIQNCI